MSKLQLLFQQNKETLEWLECYSKGNLTNEDKFEMLNQYLNEFNVPENNQLELIASGHTLLPEQPLFSILELYCKAMGLQVEYIKLGQKEALSIRMQKGWLK